MGDKLTNRIEEDKTTLPPMMQKLWNALADGKLHSCEELMKLIDVQCEIGLLRCHMSLLRTRVRSMNLGETVICEDGGYRKVRYVDVFSAETNNSTSTNSNK